MHRTIYNTLLPPTGWHLISFPPPQGLYWRTLRHDQIFFLMVLRGENRSTLSDFTDSQFKLFR